jgi:membrane-associated phospholipid phosphatase
MINQLLINLITDLAEYTSFIPWEYPGFATIFLIFMAGVFLARPVMASDRIESAGTVVQVLIPAAAYGATYYMDDPDGRTQFYESFFTSLALTYALKYTIAERRPNGGDHSFPSGHTSAAFQGAAFIHRRYGFTYSIPAYIAAGFVGYSRVESGYHFTKDVLAGAAVGIGSVFLFTHSYHGGTVTPVAESGYFGVNLTVIW